MSSMSVLPAPATGQLSARVSSSGPNPRRVSRPLGAVARGRPYTGAASDDGLSSVYTLVKSLRPSPWEDARR